MKKNLIGIMLTLFCLTACYTTRVHINKDASPVPNPKYDGGALNFGSKHHNLIGLIELSDPVALHELCPDGAAYTEHGMSFVDMLVSGVLQGFYNPMTVTFLPVVIPNPVRLSASKLPRGWNACRATSVSAADSLISMKPIRRMRVCVRPALHRCFTAASEHRFSPAGGAERSGAVRGARAAAHGRGPRRAADRARKPHDH